MRLIEGDDKLGEECDGLGPKDVDWVYMFFVLVGQLIMLGWIIYFKKEEVFIILLLINS